jgi:hypothetical protein
MSQEDPSTSSRRYIAIVAFWIVIGAIMAGAGVLAREAWSLLLLAAAVIIGAALILRGWTLLFYGPFVLAMVTGGFLFGADVHQSVYTSAAQVIPILLLAIGIEQNALWKRIDDYDDWGVFTLMAIYLAVGEAAALYGAATCDSQGLCSDDALAVSLTVGGLIGALAQATVLTLSPPSDWRPT